MMRYTENFDMLVALATHLAHVRYTSRRPSNIAKDLYLDPADVLRVLEVFPALFRRSKDPDPGDEDPEVAEPGAPADEPFFSLHVRYARAKGHGGVLKSNPLTADEFASLLTIITHVATQEQEHKNLMLQLEERGKSLVRTTRATRTGAFVAAAAAIVSAVIAAWAAVTAAGISAPPG